jgi:branched-chain amino acid transport system ATP-binding protein
VTQTPVHEREGGAGPRAGSALRASDVSVTFGGVVALMEVGIDVSYGGIHALIGPNGAGKSTLVNVVAGSLRPRTGTVELFGRDCSRTSEPGRARLGLGRTFQHPALFGTLTIRENLGLAARARARRGVEPAAWLERAIDDLDLRPWLDVVVDSAPYPVRKLTDMVRALAAGPDLLVVDEPAAGLASSERDRLAELLDWARTHLSCAILLIEHDMPLVFRLADHITVLSNGKLIAAGSPDEIRAHPDVVEAYLGTPV